MSTQRPESDTQFSADDDRTRTLAANLKTVREQIRACAVEVGRAPEDIELLPVTKFHPAEDLARLATLMSENAVAAGAAPEDDTAPDGNVRALGRHGVVVGENREQEARAKAAYCQANSIDLAIDMIGQIQSKKTNHIARWAHRVHTVDSQNIADGLQRGMELALDRGNRLGGAELPVFIQWSVDGDPSRGGCARENLDELAETISSHPNLVLEGLMVVPPLESNPRDVFDQARQLANELQNRHGGAGKLSAGMTQDMEHAIKAGSNLLRVGTAIMGSRPVTL